MKTLPRLLFVLSLVVPSAFAAPGTKGRPLDSCDSIDPKTTVQHEVVAKVITTTDPQHRKALELTIDYAKPGGYPGYMKTFTPGIVDPKKVSAVRFFCRSNSDTSFSFELLRTTQRKDGKAYFFWGGAYKASKEWTEITIPLENFKRAGGKIWKNGAQQDMPGSGEPMDEDDLSKIGQFKITSIIDQRGTATVGHLVFDSIELVEK
ncbi:MAG: carbohydrate binding domain-containing protein [Verrucomicrobiota bacterium]